MRNHSDHTLSPDSHCPATIGLGGIGRFLGQRQVGAGGAPEGPVLSSPPRASASRSSAGSGGLSSCRQDTDCVPVGTYVGARAGASSRSRRGPAKAAGGLRLGVPSAPSRCLNVTGEGGLAAASPLPPSPGRSCSRGAGAMGAGPGRGPATGRGRHAPLRTPVEERRLIAAAAGRGSPLPPAQAPSVWLPFPTGGAISLGGRAAWPWLPWPARARRPQARAFAGTGAPRGPEAPGVPAPGALSGGPAGRYRRGWLRRPRAPCQPIR